MTADSRFRSRKWIIAIASLAIVTVFAGFGLVKLAEDAGDVALILGAWAGSDTTILGLYGTVNYLSEKARNGKNG